MSTPTARARARTVNLLVAVLLCLAGGVALDTSAAATGMTVCPENPRFVEPIGGWVKYDGLTGTTYTYPQKPGFVAVSVCYKAAHHSQYVTPTGTVTSTVRNGNGVVQDISHVTVLYMPRLVPPKPPAVVAVEPYDPVPSCDTPTVLVGEVTTTTDWVFDRTTWTWVPGPASVVDARVPASLTPEAAALCEAGEKPPAEVTTVSFSTLPDCGNPEVLIGDLVTTVEYVLDIEKGAWVPGEPSVVDERVPASLTAAERLACEERPPAVETVDFSAAPSCATPTVLVGRVTTTTPWVWDSEAESWVPGEPTVLDERVAASLTPTQVAACVPTGGTPGIQTGQVVPTAARTAASGLAETGSSALLPALTALGLVALGCLTLLARRRSQA